MKRDKKILPVIGYDGGRGDVVIYALQLVTCVIEFLFI